MSWTTWASLAAICALGAISPGPSLAVVVRNTLMGGRGSGIATALAHASGIGLYALMVAFGLGVLVAESGALFRTVQLGGAAFLAYLGIMALVRGGAATGALTAPGPAEGIRGARDGFLIAFLNPKIALWFLALFSQFLRPEAGYGERFMMAGLAASIDATWYVMVAAALSQGRVLAWMRRRAHWLERLFGLVLLGLAVRVVLL